MIVYNGFVLNLESYLAKNISFLGAEMHNIIINNVGRDITRQISRSQDLRKRANCLVEKYRIGFLSNQSSGCFAAQVINYVTLVIILGLMFARFSMAIIYAWLVAPRLSRPPKGVPYLPAGVEKAKKQNPRYVSMRPARGVFSPRSSTGSEQIQDLADYRSSTLITAGPASKGFAASGAALSSKGDLFATYMMTLVTCYSEDEEGMRTTLESLAETDYNDRHKMIFMVADGIVTGGGCDRSTPDICISLLNVASWSQDPEPMSYVAIADGSKQHNMAKVVSY